MAAVDLSRGSLTAKVAELITEVGRLETETKTDALTGPPNRRALDTMAEHGDGNRHGSTFHSVLFVDIDQFGLFNKSFGQHGGDEMLTHIAALRASVCRETDTAYRNGGEEFVVSLPGLRLDEALDVGEHARARVESESIAHSDKAERAVVTITVGVATQHAEEPFSDAVERAGKPAYRAKDADRRNTVTAAIS
jgi:diguanylate cyclase (GGDEF)-like protein